MSYFKAKCTKFDFGWSCASETAEEAHGAPPEPLAEFNVLHAMTYAYK